jgi:chromosome segregation ATPase
MLPYDMREESEPRKNSLETAAAITALVILVTCVISSAPRVSQVTRTGRAAQEREQDQQSLAELRMTTNQLKARNEAVGTELVQIARLLESTKSELASLREGHKSLGAQVTTTAAKLQELETTVQRTNEQMAKFNESGTLEKIAQQRDDALTQTKQSDEQVRQLTLKLQKAGVYP